MNELKPCPFCGSAARWAATVGSDDDSWEIQCTNNDCCIVLFAGATGRETLKAWNTRKGNADRENERLPRECQHCHRAIYKPTEEIPYWHDSDKFASFYCKINHEYHKPATQDDGE